MKVLNIHIRFVLLLIIIQPVIGETKNGNSLCWINECPLVNDEILSFHDAHELHLYSIIYKANYFANIYDATATILEDNKNLIYNLFNHLNYIEHDQNIYSKQNVVIKFDLIDDEAHKLRLNTSLFELPSGNFYETNLLSSFNALQNLKIDLGILVNNHYQNTKRNHVKSLIPRIKVSLNTRSNISTKIETEYISTLQTLKFEAQVKYELTKRQNLYLIVKNNHVYLNENTYLYFEILNMGGIHVKYIFEL